MKCLECRGFQRNQSIFLLIYYDFLSNQSDLSRAWSVKADARMFETISLNWGIIYVSLKIYTNFFENYSVKCYSKIIRNILAGYLQTLAKRRGVKIMCGTEKDKCQFPEKLKGKPEDCSPEQIKECHGEGAEHPCVDSKEEE